MIELLFQGVNALSAAAVATMALLSLFLDKKRSVVETRPVLDRFSSMGYNGRFNDLSVASNWGSK